MRTNPEKIDKILHWPTPQKITPERGLLTSCTYYKRFIEGFSTIKSPIYKLALGLPKPGFKIDWFSAKEEVFKSLNSKMANPMTLVHPIPFHLFVLDTDVSGTNIGSVLQQDTVVE